MQRAIVEQSEQGSELNLTRQITGGASDVEQPVLFIDVHIAPAESRRISIYDGDTAEVIAEAFCVKYNLPPNTKERLSVLLQD